MSCIKEVLKVPVRFLNQPIIKENVKNFAGLFTFACGLLEIHDVLRGRAVSTEVNSKAAPASTWSQANKVSLVCARISLILSAGVSRPGVYLISTLTGCVFSTSQLERAFGPNTTFAVNPWHPRHVVSIAAFALSLPAVAQSTYQAYQWAKKKVQQQHVKAQQQPASPKGALAPLTDQAYLTEAKERLINLFNTVTSRVTLHLGNRLAHALIKRV